MEKLIFINTSRFLFLACMLLSLIGCKSDYQRYVEEEIGSDIQNDSLIFGMRMGQTKKEFFAICWELNKQKLISQGTGNSTARFITDRDTSGNNSPLSKEMLFYGIFDGERHYAWNGNDLFLYCLGTLE